MNLFAMLLALGLGADPAPGRVRLVVLTDISSLTAGQAEPDDGQSMIRLMLYANEFDIEGLVATSNLGHGQRVRPDLIRRVVDAYGEALPNLRRHDPHYPDADVIRAVVKSGQPVAGPQVPVEESVGPGKDTEGSDWIIQVLDRPDPRPAWVLIWGGSADLAQALRTVRETRTPEERARFEAKLRVHSIGDQDSTGAWIKEQFPGVRIITQRRAYRGMYRGGDTSLVSSEWVEANVSGRGPLGSLYPNYRGGDIFGWTLGPVRGIKEGDTPSFLALVPNGLNDPDRPELGGWGGRFAGEGNHLEDVVDPAHADPDDPDPRMGSVHRWRPAFQADFRARLDWTVEPPGRANHHPVPAIAGDRTRRAKVGAWVELDARGSTDPDGDGLAFAWEVYPDDHGDSAPVEIEGRDGPVARVRVPPGWEGRTVPILLTVRDGGRPALTRYARAFLEVEPTGPIPARP